MTPFTNPAVAHVFEAYPPQVRRNMLALRELVFKTAASTPGVGPLEETFKTLFPKDFQFEGNRAIVFKLADAVPTDALQFCVAAALTYHRK